MQNARANQPLKVIQNPSAIATEAPAIPQKLETLDKLKLALELVANKKAEEPVIMNMSGLTTLSDYFFVASGASNRQVAAMADAIMDGLRKYGYRPYQTEGFERGNWILLDYGDIIFHLFLNEARTYYNLEKLWADAPRVTFHNT